MVLNIPKNARYVCGSSFASAIRPMKSIMQVAPLIMADDMHEG